MSKIAQKESPAKIPDLLDIHGLGSLAPLLFHSQPMEVAMNQSETGK